MLFEFIRPSKAAIRELPIFKGLSLTAITLVSNDAELAQARLTLEECDHIGFDTESKPTFKKGEVSDGPHVIQLASSDHAFLFTAHFLPGIELALSILVNSRIKKYGFGLGDDRRLFLKKYGVTLSSLVDLAKVLKHAGDLKQDVGARAGVAMLFQQRLSKSVQRSNWSQYPLSDRQVKYAANDAYAGICIANQLMALGVSIE